jgi:NADH-quinone oxidoreductase subunit I
MSEKKSYPDLAGHLKALKVGFKYLAENRRITLMYPEVRMELPSIYRGMITLDIKKCIQCGLCARICPASAIKMYRRKGKRNPGLDYARCIFCGFCVDICPEDALAFTDVHDTAYYNFVNLKFSPDELSRRPEPIKKAPKKVKVVFDEKRGLRHE